MPTKAAQFTLWDFLVDVIPGAIAILLVASILPSPYISPIIEQVMPLGFGGIFLIIVLSYVSGWMIQGASRYVDRPVVKLLDFPRPIRTQLDQARADQEHDHHSLRRRYLEGAQVFFDDTNAEDYTETKQHFDDVTLRNLTQSYLLDNEIGRMHRFHMLYVFMRNLYVLFGIGAVLHLVILFGDYGSFYNSIWNQYESIVLVVILATGSGIAYNLRKFFQKNMIKAMMRDFYTAELCN